MTSLIYCWGQPETTKIIWVTLDCLTAKLVCLGKRSSLDYHTQWAFINIDVTYVQYVGRDLSSPQLISPRLDMYGERLQEWRGAGGTNKRLSEKSSHCATVNCQLWYEAGALLLPADKVRARAVCWAVVSVHEVRWRKARLWLQRRPLGEAFLAALYNEGTRRIYILHFSTCRPY